MTSREMAEGCLAQAGEILAEAHELSRRKVWNLVVRRSQEVVELALKGALRSAGVEVPKIHDVGVILKDHGEGSPRISAGTWTGWHRSRAGSARKEKWPFTATKRPALRPSASTLRKTPG